MSLEKSVLNELIIRKNIVYSAVRVSQNDIYECEELLATGFGKQLTDYILSYGFLKYGDMSIFGITGLTLLDESTLVEKTRLAHDKYPETSPYVCVENRNGSLFLVDVDDKMYAYETDSKKIIDLRCGFYEYLIRRISAVNNASILRKE